MNLTVFFALLLLLVVGYAAYVLRRINRAVCYTGKQKRLQKLIVIIFPLFGAWFIHAMYRSDDEIPIKQDKDFDPLHSPEI